MTLEPVRPRIKNYVTKVIFARVNAFGRGQAHVYVPSHWRDQTVSLRRIDSKRQKAFQKDVRNYSKFSCHVPMSVVNIGDIFEITLEDHQELCRTILQDKSE